MRSNHCETFSSGVSACMCVYIRCDSVYWGVRAGKAKHTPAFAGCSLPACKAQRPRERGSLVATVCNQGLTGPTVLIKKDCCKDHRRAGMCIVRSHHIKPLSLLFDLSAYKRGGAKKPELVCLNRTCSAEGASWIDWIRVWGCRVILTLWKKEQRDHLKTLALSS